MISKEAKALPGGFLATALLFVGAASLFTSLLVAALEAGGARSLGGAWLAVPAWGLVAVTLAIILRKGGSSAVRILGAIWLVPALAFSIAATLGLQELPFV